MIAVEGSWFSYMVAEQAKENKLTSSVPQCPAGAGFPGGGLYKL